MTETFDFDDFFSPRLRCPCCKETYLHAETVETWNRKEDAEFCNVTRINSDGSVSSSVEPSRLCPSPRRHAVRIFFNCEFCERDHIGVALEIIQHKGQTFFETFKVKTSTRYEVIK